MKMHFEKAQLKYKDTIFSWLEEPHVREFWDNSEAHKNDIINFMNGRKEPSNYNDGLYTYWLGLIDEEPYCLVMTLEEKLEYDIPLIKKEHLSKTGSTYSVDYMIGNQKYFGKGLGAKTLRKFIDFFKVNCDKNADTFFIDPDINNPRARHVYEQAGFKYIDDFIMEGKGAFAGRKTHFLVKKLLAPNLKIKNIVFDVGNVIVKWSPHEVLQSVFPEEPTEKFLQKIRPIWIDLNLGKISEKKAIILYRDQFNLPEDKLTRMLSEFKTSQLPIPGMIELLQKLHELGIPLYAITDNVKEIIEWHRTHSHFLHYFKGVVVSADIGILKPDARIYQYLLNKYKLVPSESIFIDDTQVNVDGALVVGMQAFQFIDIKSCIDKLRSLGFEL